MATKVSSNLINSTDAVSGTMLAADGTGGTTWSVGIPAGATMFFAMSAAPTGWLECNGATVSRSTYNVLWLAIGTTYGAGDGSTTFKLPDLRGEFIRGWDRTRGIDSGRVFGSAQGDLIENHTHTVAIVQGTATGSTPAFTGGGFNTGSTTTSTNAGGGNETRPRNVALLPCIKF